MGEPIPVYRDYRIERSDAPAWCRDMRWLAFPVHYYGEEALFGATPDECREAIDEHMEWLERRRAVTDPEPSLHAQSQDERSLLA